MERLSILLISRDDSSSARLALAGMLRQAAEYPGLRVYANGIPGLTPPSEDLAGISGVVAWGGCLEATERYRAAGLPVVLVGAGEAISASGISVLAMDLAAVGRMAAEELLEQGAARLVFLAEQDGKASEALWHGFRETAQKKGLGAERHLVPAALSLLAEGPAEALPWLKGLGLFKADGRMPEMQAGFFASSDRLARWLAAALRKKGVGIPEMLLLLGYGNDPLFTEGGIPSLSSIEPNFFLQGSEAVRRLFRLCHGEEPAMWLPADTAKLVRRESTTSTGGHGQPASKALLALAYMERNLQLSIDIDRVASHFGMTRRSLELQFRRASLRPPAKEFARLRVEKAKKLLDNSQMTAKEVAFACGFQDVKRLFRSFKKETGLTPLAYRRSQAGKR